MRRLLRALRRSWTAWLGVLLIVWGPEIQALAQPVLADWFGDAAAANTLRLIGILVIALRAKIEIQRRAPPGAAP